MAPILTFARPFVLVLRSGNCVSCVLFVCLSVFRGGCLVLLSVLCLVYLFTVRL